MQTINVDKNAIPYSADIRIGVRTYTFTFHYNSEGDFFTVDLVQGEENLVVGEKIVYGKALFTSYLDERFPFAAIIPIDLSMQAEKIGWQELGKSVFLYVITAEEMEAVLNE